MSAVIIYIYVAIIGICMEENASCGDREIEGNNQELDINDK